MSISKKINFTLDGIDGELTLVHAPFITRLYQNNQRLKRKGVWRKFNAQTTDGKTETIRVKRTRGFKLYVVFREQASHLEERISIAEFVIRCLPSILGFTIGFTCGYLLNVLRY